MGTRWSDKLRFRANW